MLRIYLILAWSMLPLSLYGDFGKNIDRLYNNISEHILNTSEYIDDMVSQWMGYEQNRSCHSATPILETKSKSIDSFFLNNKYFNDTDDIFVRFRLKTKLNSRSKDTINASLSAQLPFDKCKTQWKIFLQDINRYSSEVKSTDSFTGGVGLRYNQKDLYGGIDTSLSLGLYGGHPYLRGRFKYPLVYDRWIIEPVQIFQYSTKYYFEEETNIYFDKYPNDHDLFRIQLHRKTSSKIRGMDYGVSLRFYRYTDKNAGFEISQSVFGNTYYNDFYANDPSYSGINNFVTSFGWRSRVWRKWLYYELRPTINFHKDRNYKPTYSLRFYLDFYFGKYH